MRKHVLPVLLFLCVLAALLPLSGAADAAAAEHSHLVCGETTCTDESHGHSTEELSYTVWSGSYSIGSSGKTTNYYLTSDISRTSSITVSGTVNLCLNGHVIQYTGTGTNPVFSILSGATLNLCDCNGSGKTHKFSVDSNGLWTLNESGGTKAVTGGVITGGRKSGVYVSNNTCTFNMYSGTIAGNRYSNNYGGGVYVISGKLSTYGGAISGNTAKYGGGVYVTSGTLSTYGGTISDNTADYGGGVYVYSGKLSTYGGSISGNTAKYGGGVYADNGSIAAITGTTISGNTASQYGGGVYVNIGTATIMDTTISANTAKYGGGIYLSGSYSTTNDIITTGTLAITDTSITGNTAKYGGGVYKDSSSSHPSILKLSGKVDIKENTGAEGNNNLSLQGFLTVDGDLTGSTIGVICDSGVFTSGAGVHGVAVENQTVFTTDREKQCLVVEGNGADAELSLRNYPKVYFYFLNGILDSNDENRSTLPEAQSIPYGSTLPRPEKIPSAPGHTFVDWCYWDEVAMDYLIYDFDVPVTTEYLSLYAIMAPYKVTQQPSKQNDYTVVADGEPESYQWFNGTNKPLKVTDRDSDSAVAAEKDLSLWWTDLENPYSTYSSGKWRPCITWQGENSTEGGYFTLFLTAGDVLTVTFDKPLGPGGGVQLGSFNYMVIPNDPTNLSTRTVWEFTVPYSDTYVLFAVANSGEGYTLSPVTATLSHANLSNDSAKIQTLAVGTSNGKKTVRAEASINFWTGEESSFANGKWTPAAAYHLSNNPMMGFPSNATYFAIDLRAGDMLTVTFDGALPRGTWLVAEPNDSENAETLRIDTTSDRTYIFHITVSGAYQFSAFVSDGIQPEDWPKVSATVIRLENFADAYDFPAASLEIGASDSENSIRAESDFSEPSGVENYGSTYENGLWSPAVMTFEGDVMLPDRSYGHYFMIDLEAGNVVTVTFDDSLPDGTILYLEEMYLSFSLRQMTSSARSYSFTVGHTGTYVLYTYLPEYGVTDWPNASATLSHIDYSTPPDGLLLVGTEDSGVTIEAKSDLSEWMGEGAQTTCSGGAWTPFVVNYNPATEANYFVMNLNAGDVLNVVLDGDIPLESWLTLFMVDAMYWLEFPTTEGNVYSYQIVENGTYALVLRTEYEHYDFPTARAFLSSARVAGQNTNQLTTTDPGSYLCQVTYADGTVIYSQSVTISSAQAVLPGIIQPGPGAVPPVDDSEGASSETPDEGTEDDTEESDGKLTVASFTDVPQTAWYSEAVDYVAQEGLMKGTSDTTFDPNSNATRAMILTILYRMDDTPSVDGTHSFSDVKDGVYYSDAVLWAVENNITDGLGDGIFGPNEEVTREQLAVLLYRYVKYCDGGFDADWTFQLDYTDAEKVSDWAYEAMCWMTMNGIIQGKNGNRLDPQGPATRAEIAQVLARFAQFEL